MCVGITGICSLHLYLLWVPVPVEEQVEPVPEPVVEERAPGRDVGLEEVVLVAGLLHVKAVVEEVLERGVPVRLEEGETGRGQLGAAGRRAVPVEVCQERKVITDNVA